MLLIMLIQLLLGVSTYISMLDMVFVKIIIHAIVLINSLFLHLFVFSMAFFSNLMCNSYVLFVVCL